MNQTNLISIVILWVILFSFRKTYGTDQKRNRYFFMLIWTTIGLLVFDMVNDVLAGSSVLWIQSLYQGMIVLYALLQISIVILWVLYIDVQVNNKLVIPKPVIYLSILMVLSMVTLIVLSLFGDFIYVFDSSGVLGRGSLFFLFPLFSMMFFMYALKKIMEHRKTMSQTDLLTLLIVPLAPMLGAVLELIDPEFSLIWPSMTVSILILYVYIQSKMTSTDPLTGVFNRMEYEHRIGQILHQRTISKTVGSILIDIDDLKKINDGNSHSEGDRALLEIGGILRRSVRKNDQVFRIGGDEFFILVDTENEEILKDIVQRIIEQLKYVNLYRKEFKLNLSYGYGVFVPSKYATFYDFFDEIDKKMYRHKLETKTTQAPLQ